MLAPAAAAYVPALHALQSVSLTAEMPGVKRYFPAIQLMHGPGENIHSPSNPASESLPSEMKVICKNPVVETYAVSVLVKLPESFANCTGESHAAVSQLLMDTKSQHASVLNELKKTVMGEEADEVMSH